jgi:uncharacterized protein
MSQYYRSYNHMLRQHFGQAVYKITLDAGFTCPNRDGTKGSGGCTFCDETGSSSRAQDKKDSIAQQLLTNMEKQRHRFKANRFIAYFQSYTNTYSPVVRLKRLYDEAMAAHPDIVGLAISTRPDCVTPENAALIASYQQPGRLVSLELGLQTIHNHTLQRLNRCETVEDFYAAMALVRQHQLAHCIHVILDLPGETWADQMATADVLARLRVDGVKIHLLVAMENTPIAAEFLRGEWQPLDRVAYVQLVCDFIERLHPETVIHRVAGNGHPKHVVAPLWMKEKHDILREVDAEFARRGTRQGSQCQFLEGEAAAPPLVAVSAMGAVTV